MADEFLLTSSPDSRRRFLSHLVGHVDVLFALARKDFQTRYKRASFGVIWAVALPVLHGAVLGIVFSRVARFPMEGLGVPLHAYVMAGMLPYAYASMTLSVATTSVVDGSGLADKVWFPRAVLVLVPFMSGLVGLGVSTGVGFVLIPAIGGRLSPETVFVVPSVVLVVTLTAGAGLVLSALHVYYRDVKFLVQAVLMVLIYLTPIIYPRAMLGDLEWLVDLNPLTGPVSLYQTAFGAQGIPLLRPCLISVGVATVLLLVGFEAHRRHDRRFVDLL